MRRQGRNATHIGALATLLVACLWGDVANADEPTQAERQVLLLQIFEGHGIARPTDPMKARAMELWAQRASAHCSSAYLERGGGTGTMGARCGEAANPGPDAAAAILDTLNDVRTSAYMPRFSPRFELLTRALGRTQRTDVIPPLVRAMERLTLRVRYPDYFNAREDAGMWTTRINAIDAALEQLTLAPQRLGRRDNNLDWANAITGRWREWLEQHGGEQRSQWEQRALQRAEELIATGTKSGASDALVLVLNDAATRTRARRLVPTFRGRFGELTDEVKQALKAR